jgi:hypothetical protein
MHPHSSISRLIGLLHVPVGQHQDGVNSFHRYRTVLYNGGQPSQAETMGWPLHGPDRSTVICLDIAP